MPLDKKMMLQNPDPQGRKNQVTLDTVRHYATDDTNHDRQQRTKALLKSLVQSGAMSQEEYDGMVTDKKEFSGKNIFSGGEGKETDEIIEGTGVTKDSLNNPNDRSQYNKLLSLAISPQGCNREAVLPFMAHLDPENLVEFLGCDDPQVRLAVAQRMNLNDLKLFVNEANLGGDSLNQTQILDKVVSRIPAIDGAFLLQNNPNLDDIQRAVLEYKIDKFEKFVADNVDSKLLQPDVAKKRFEEINKLEGSEFNYVMDRIKDELSLLSKDSTKIIENNLSPEKLKDYFEYELNNDPEFSNRTEAEKVKREEETDRLKVYVVGKKIVTDKDYASGLGKAVEKEIDKSELLDLSNEADREEITSIIGKEALDAISPDGELVSDNDIAKVKELKKIAKQLGAKGFVLSDGGNTALNSVQLLDKSALQEPIPTETESENIFKDEEGNLNFADIITNNYKGLVEIAKMYADKTNSANIDTKAKLAIIEKLNPADVILFGNDGDVEVRLAVAKGMPESNIKDMMEYEKDDSVRLALLERTNNKELLNKASTDTNEDIRKEVSKKLKDPLYVKQMLTDELSKETPNDEIVNNLLNNINDKEISSLLGTLPDDAILNRLNTVGKIDKKMATPFLEKGKEDIRFATAIANIMPDNSEMITNDYISTIMNNDKFDKVDKDAFLGTILNKANSDQLVSILNKQAEHISDDTLNDLFNNPATYSKISSAESQEKFLINSLKGILSDPNRTNVGNAIKGVVAKLPKNNTQLIQSPKVEIRQALASHLDNNKLHMMFDDTDWGVREELYKRVKKDEDIASLYKNDTNIDNLPALRTMLADRISNGGTISSELVKALSNSPDEVLSGAMQSLVGAKDKEALSNIANMLNSGSTEIGKSIKASNKPDIIPSEVETINNEVKKQIEPKKKTIKDIDKDLNTIDKDLDNEKSNIKATKEEKISKVQNEILDINDSIIENEDSIENAREELSKYEEKLDKLTDKLAEYKVDPEENVDEIENINGKIEQVKEMIDSAKDFIAEMEEENEKSSKKVDKLQKQLDKLIELPETSSKLEALNDAKKSTEKEKANVEINNKKETAVKKLKEKKDNKNKVDVPKKEKEIEKKSIDVISNLDVQSVDLSMKQDELDSISIELSKLTEEIKLEENEDILDAKIEQYKKLNDELLFNELVYNLTEDEYNKSIDELIEVENERIDITNTNDSDYVDMVNTQKEEQLAEYEENLDELKKLNNDLSTVEELENDIAMYKRTYNISDTDTAENVKAELDKVTEEFLSSPDYLSEYKRDSLQHIVAKKDNIIAENKKLQQEVDDLKTKFLPKPAKHDMIQHYFDLFDRMIRKNQINDLNATLSDIGVSKQEWDDIEKYRSDGSRTVVAIKLSLISINDGRLKDIEDAERRLDNYYKQITRYY